MNISITELPKVEKERTKRKWEKCYSCFISTLIHKTNLPSIWKQLKADDTWYSFLRPRDWEILIMEGLFHVPSNDEKQQTFRVRVSDNLPRPPTAPGCAAYTIPMSQPVENVEKKWLLVSESSWCFLVILSVQYTLY